MSDKIILQLDKITKEFPGVKALDEVCLNIYEGKVMALLGENGAGKSTLMKIVSGVYKKTSGNLIFKGEPLDVKGPKDAMEKGISIIHQELNLIDELTIAENIFMGRLSENPLKVNWKDINKKSQDLLKQLDVNISPKTLVKKLSIGEKQMIEIAKALSFNSDIIIMDEPTDALTDKESESLFKVIDSLKKQGKSIVYISHRLDEIFKICDNITVIRDGKFIGEEKVCDIDNDRLIEMMVGRKLENQYPYIDCIQDDEVFTLNSLSNKYFDKISLSVKKGEILGVSGLMGSGRTELAKSIFGNIPTKSKDMYLDGKKVYATNEKTSINEGILYVSEDRKKDGLVLGLSVGENITLSSLEKLSKNLFLNKAKENEEIEFYKKSMSIKTPSSKQKVKLLSGGNQQKVAIAKALLAEPKLLIIDEPTRGVDVGAKREIYQLLNGLKESGMGIIMISSEIPELLGVCDRIAVMSNRKISGELKREEFSQEKILKLAIGA